MEEEGAAVTYQVSHTYIELVTRIHKVQLALQSVSPGVPARMKVSSSWRSNNKLKSEELVKKRTRRFKVIEKSKIIVQK